MSPIHSFHVAVRAPSNIALIKYMGKEPGNIPANGSLSLTLQDLCTFLEIRGKRGASGVTWSTQQPKHAPTTAVIPSLNEAAKKRILTHFERVAKVAGHDLAEWSLDIRTANTFPQASGIASSASSFAAGTLAIAQAFGKGSEDLSAWAREGSGSACRSFAGPWVQWDHERGKPVPNVHASLAETNALKHWVLIVESRAKTVGSSEAHQRVRTSPQWQGRTARAESRLAQSVTALQTGDWSQLCHLAWDEFNDMHTLFETAGFEYQTAKTRELLTLLKPSVGEILVTLDAGPNIHVIARTMEAEKWQLNLAELGVPLLTDQPGTGAKVLLNEWNR